MVEFTLYSVTANLHIYVTLAAEFSLSGKYNNFITDTLTSFISTANTI